jgi:uncharacterized protein YbcI
MHPSLAGRIGCEKRVRCGKRGENMIAAGDLKQEILRIYNAVNKQIFDAGVRQQHVDFVGNKILIVSRNTRVPILKLLGERYPETIHHLDYLLSETFKELLRKELEQQLKLNILVLFKDYDAQTEFSGTVVVLDQNVSGYHE